MNTRYPNTFPPEAPARKTPRRFGWAAASPGTFVIALALSLNPIPAGAADAKAPATNTPRAMAKPAPAKPSAPAKNDAASETPAVQTAPSPTEIPKSVFLLSSPTQTLKDPFFPNSTRLAAGVASRNSGQKKDAPTAELALKAIFGTPSRPFVTINSTTLGLGEEQEVLTSAGRVRVRCLEINLAAQTAIIEVGGSRRELRFGTPK
jgi:hypothetical protein